MNKVILALLASVTLLAVATSLLSPVSAGPAPQSSRGRKGPWVKCPPQKPNLPRRATSAYSPADERRMEMLQAEVVERVEEMNEIVRRTTGKPGPDGPVVQFTLFTGCPDDPNGGMMMEFIQQPTENEAPDSFFDVFVGGSGGGGGGSGGCHCETNMVSCEGPCPC